MIHIVLICLAYIMGIIWGLYLDLNLGIAFFVLIVCVYIFLKKYIIINLKIFAIIMAFFTFGMIYASIRLEDFKSKYVEGDINTIIKIIKLDSKKEKYSTYICKNEFQDNFLVYVSNEIQINIGDELYVRGLFEKPEGVRNRGGFDYSKYLYSKNIYGILRINKDSEINLIKKSNVMIINKIQESIYNILGRVFPKNELGIVLGMLIGDISYVSEDIQNDFKDSGISHLLAVSGSNINYIILFSKFVFGKIFGKKISNYFVIVFIIIFVLVSGASSSVVRAGIMGIIIILADIFAKKSNVYSSIAISAFLILIYNPLIIFDIGFVLSFAGTFGIVFLYEKLQGFFITNFVVKNKILIYMLETLAVTLSAQIILLPIMMYSFNSISTLSLITNIIIVPFAGILTILGFVIYVSGLIFFPLAKFLSYIVFVLTKLIITIAKIFADFKYSTILIFTPKILWIIIYYLLIYKIVKRVKNKFINYFLFFLIFIALLIEVWPCNYVKINFVDVGHGDCTYIETKNKKTILIDGGGSENSDYNIGEKIVMPYLLDRGKMKIDLMIISHMHDDHVEGLLTVIENIKVGKILVGPIKEKTKLYEDFISIVSKKGITLQTIYGGDVIKIDDITIDILYPNEQNEIEDNENNNSLVFKLNYFDMSILFTGDIEKEVENKLKKDIAANILKVPHHGSKTSSTEGFIQKVKPQISIISVGDENNFGHPNQDVVNRLKKNESIIYRTDICGEIMIKLYKNKMKINTLIKE